MSLFTKDTLPKSAQDAMRVFDERYNAVVAAGDPPTWHTGFEESTDTPIITFPLSSFTSGFTEERDEGGRYRGLEGKTFDLNVVTYSDGYEAKLSDLIAHVFAWKRWGEAPAEFPASEQRLSAEMLAALFEAGTTTACPYDGVNMFSTAHLCDPNNPESATFSNYNSTPGDPTDMAVLQAEMTTMQGAVKDVNGKKLAVNPTEIWLSTAKFLPVSHALSKAFINGGDSNPMVGKLKPVHIPDLTDADDWALVDPVLMAKYPAMVSMKCTLFDGQLGMTWFDEASDFFKNTGKLRVKKRIWRGASLLFPHAIRLRRGA